MQKMKRLLFYLLVLTSFTASTQELLFREDFLSLDEWEPIYFPNIREHTEYMIEKSGEESFLIARSSSSASGLALKKKFNVHDFPRLLWRWKIENVYAMGDAKKKSGDDYPIRIYVMFEFEPELASFAERVKFGLYKTLYGKYPPLNTLNYIWANKKHRETMITNTYTDRSKMIVLRSGNREAGSWVMEKVNVFDDYRRAFGKDPPRTAKIAVMNDSDNTGESSASYIDFIEVRR
jgi:hypothetical protein